MTATSDCVFCRIVARQLPACVVHEDAETLAFMDIGPIIPGHVLVIPKAHVDPLDAMPPALLHRVIDVAQRVARAQRAALKADGINLMQANGRAAGQDVPHVHVHVIPRFSGDGHRWNWTPHPYARPAEMAALADRIRAAL